MAVITVSVDDEVYERFRKFAAGHYNGKKGFLGDAITAAMSKTLNENDSEAARHRLRERARKGYNLGTWKQGFDRDLLYDRN